MSQQNVERLQVVYAEWAKGNFHAGLDLLDPAVVFRAFDAFEDEDLKCRGPEAIADFLTFREGRVTEIRWLRNRGKALDAAGLKE